MLVENTYVYGLQESVIASGYPFGVTLGSKMDEDEEPTERQFEIASRLAQSQIGSGHDNFQNGIVVQFDLTTSNKMWTELQRYHFIDFVSSQSTIHCMGKFDLSDRYVEQVDPRIIEIIKELQEKYNKNPTTENRLALLYSNPAGFLLKARMTTNYRQLKTIYAQRNSHTLPEWREFCEWIKELPESQWITGEEQE